MTSRPAQPRSQHFRLDPHLPRPGRRLAATLATAALVMGGVVGIDVVRPTPAEAFAPFPINDISNGSYTPSMWTTNYAQQCLGAGDVPFSRTSDNWMRMTFGTRNCRANMLTTQSFPSTTGLSISFDYRMVGRMEVDGKAGDGFSVYLSNGSQSSVTAGGPGGGLAYARHIHSVTGTSPGVLGGFMGVGIDAYGSYSSTEEGRTGGNMSIYGRPAIGLRGSGNGNGPTDALYPWVNGAVVSNLTTGSSGTPDPSTQSTSTYRRVNVTINPVNPGLLEAVVSISPSTVKNQQPTSMTRVFTGNLAGVYAQQPLPATLKLGIGASTGMASAIMDIKNVIVTALTDAAASGSMVTPGYPGLDAPAFLVGDTVTWNLTATNHGPSRIGDPPNGVAVLYDDVSSVFDTVSWTCTPSGGATCGTTSGTSPIIRTTWYGPAGSSVTIQATGTVKNGAAVGDHDLGGVIPTDFANNTVAPGSNFITLDGSIGDVNLDNNTVRLPIKVVNANLSFDLTASPTAPTSYVVGQAIQFTHTVSNPGASPITGITIIPESFTPAGAAVLPGPLTWNWPGAAGTLQPGQTATATATYVLTQADVNTGSLTYVAHAEAVSVNSFPLVSPPRTVTLNSNLPSWGNSSVSITQGPRQADGVDSHTVTVILRDANNQPVVDRTAIITKSVDPSAGVTLGTTLQGPPGTYTFTVVSTSAGTKNVTVGYPGLSPWPSLPALFVAGPPSPLKSSFVIVPSTLPVGETATARVTLIDAYDNPLIGEVISFTADQNGLISGTQTATTNSSGVAELPLTTTQAGLYTVHARRGTTELSDSPKDVTFTAGPPCTATMTSDVEPLTTGVKVADMVDTHSAKVTLRDCAGNPTRDWAVTFSLVGANPSGTGLTITTDSNGEARLNFASDSYRTHTATLRAQFTVATTNYQIPVKGSPTVYVLNFDFATNPPSPDTTWYDLSTGTRIANGSDAHTITVLLRDSNNNPISGQETWLSATAAGRAGQGNATVTAFAETSTPGRYTASVTSTAQGIKDVTVSWSSQGLPPAMPISPLVAGRTTLEFVYSSSTVHLISVTKAPAGPLTADGVQAYTVTAVIQDAQGNGPADMVALLGRSLTAGDPRGVVISQITPVAGSPGSYSFTVTSTSSGDKTLTVTFDPPGGAQESGSVVLGFVHGPPDPNHFTLTSTTRSTVKQPNGTEWHDATITIYDAFDNLVTTPADQTAVSFQLISGTGARFAAGYPNSGTTSNGTLTTRIVADVPTDAVIGGMAGTFVILSGGAPARLTLPFRWGICVTDPDQCIPPPCDDPALTYYTLAPAGPLAVGSGTYTITARLLAPNCIDPMTGQAQYLSATAIDTLNAAMEYRGTVTAFTETSPGNYTASITATKAGIKQVATQWSYTTTTQVIPPLNPPNRSTVEFIADPDPDWTKSWYEVSSGERAADGVEAHQVNVTLVDRYDNPVIGAASRLAGSSTLIATGQANLVTFGAFSMVSPGVYRASITSMTSGVHRIYVTLDRIPASAGRDDVPFQVNRDATFRAVTPGWARLTVTGGPSQAVETGTYTLQVEVLDRAGGNPVDGIPVTLGLSGAAAGQPYFTEVGNPSPQVTKTTGTAGIVTVQVKSTKSGEFPVSVTIPGLGTILGLPATLIFTPGDVDLTASRLWTDDTGARYADGQSYYTVNVELLDRFGNKVPGKSVEFIPSAPGQAISPDPADRRSGPDGRVSVHVVSSAVGPVVVTARAEGALLVLPSGGPQQVNLMFVAKDIDYNQSFFTLPTDADNKVAGNSADPHKILIWIYDSSGNPIDLCVDSQGLPAPCRFDQLAGTALGPEGNGVIGAFRKALPSEVPGSGYDGSQYIADITSITSGIKQISPSYAGNSFRPLQIGRDKVTFIAGPPSQTNSSYTVSTTPRVVADGVSTQTVTAQLRDANGNPCTGFATSLQGQAPPAIVGGFTPIDSQPGFYIASITSRVAGSHPVTVALNAAPIAQFTLAGSGNTLATFVAGDPDPSKSTLVVTPTSQEVGLNVTATITVRDAEDNPVPGTAVRISAAPPTVPGFPGGYLTATSDANGVAQMVFTTTKAGLISVTGELAVTQREVSGSPVPVTFRAGAPYAATLVKTSPADKLAASGTVRHSAKLTLVDRYDNPIGGQTIDFSLSGLTGATLIPAGGVTTSADGEALVEAHSTAVGLATLTAQVRGLTVPVTPPSITFEWINAPGPATVTFDLTTGTRVVGDAANPHRVTITVKDSNGVPIQGIEDQIAITAGDATIGDVRETSTPGVYTAPITATVAGTKTVQVSYGTNTGQPEVPGRNTVTFVAGTPSADRSSIWVTTGTRVANGVAYHVVTVDLRDEWDNPVSGWATTLGQPGMTPTIGRTVTSFDPDPAGEGRYLAQVTAIVATDYTAIVRIPGVGDIPAKGNNVIARFVAGPPSPDRSELVALTSGDRYAVSQEHVVRLTVRDAQGNPIPLATATISTVPPLSLPGGGQVTTDTAGVADLAFTSPVAGLYTVHAAIDLLTGGTVAPQGSGVVQVRFITGNPSTANSFFEVSQRADQIANGGPTHFQTATLFLADSNNVPIAGRADQIDAWFVPAGPTFTKVAGIDWVEDTAAGPGWYRATIVSLKSGDFAMKAQVGSTAINVKLNANDIASFIPGPGDPSRSILSVDKTTAQVGEQVVATVQVYDVNGNPGAGQVVELWTVERDPIGGSPYLRLRAGADGKVSFILSTTKAGTYTVYAGLLLDENNPPVQVINSGQIDVTWLAGPVSVLRTSLDGSSGVRVADGVAYHEAVVVARDEFGNTLSGVPVVFELTGVGQVAAGYAVSDVTGSDGSLTVRYVSSFVLGSAELRARVGSGVSSFLVTDNAPVPAVKVLYWSWENSGPPGSNSYFVVPTDTKRADGVASHTVEVVLATDQGAPVVGEQANIDVRVNPVAGSPVQPSGTTWTVGSVSQKPGEPGHYVVSVTSTYAATFRVEVLYKSMSLPANPVGRDTITFTAGDPDPGKSGFVVSSTLGVKANGTDFQTVTVTLLDGFGNGIADQVLTTSAVVNNNLLNVGSWTPGPVGVYTARLRTTTAGSYTMIVSRATPGGSVPVAVFVGANDVARFEPDDPCQSNTTFTIVSKATGQVVTSVPVGLESWDGFVLRAQVMDCSATPNPVPGIPVAVSVPGVEPVFTELPKLTGATGVAEFDLKSTKAGSFLVTATVNSGEFTKTATAVFTPLAPDPRVSTLTGTDGEARFADNTAFHTAVATVMDRYANVIADVPVAFDVRNVGYEASAVPTNHRTGPDGKVTIQIKSDRQVGEALVSATMGTPGVAILDASDAPKVLRMRFVSKEVDPGNSYYTVSTGSRVAGDNANPHQVRVELYDSAGAPAATDPALIRGEATGGGVVGGFTLVPGTIATYVASITSNTIGWKDITVKVSDQPINSVPGEPTAVLFVAGPVAGVVYTVSDGVLPADGTSAHTVTVTITDANGNGIDGLAAQLEATAPNCVVTYPFENPEVGVYTASITSVVKGDHLVTATRNGQPITLKTAGNNLARFTNSSPPDLSRSTLVVSDGDKPVGENHTATVTVVDNQGNPIPNVPVTVWATPNTTPTPLDAHGTTDNDGKVVISFTSHKVGVYTVYASLDTTQNPARQVSGSGQQYAIFVAGPPSAEWTTLEGTDDVTKLVNSPSDPHRAWVIVRDQYQNLVTKAGTMVTFTLSGLPGASLSTTAPIEVDINGRAEVRVTSTAQGTAVVRASVSQAGAPTITVIKPADHLNLVFDTSTVDPASSNYQLSADTRVANLVDAHTITVRLRDINGARVHNAQDLISVVFTPRGAAPGVPVVGTWSEGSDPLTSYGDYTASITSRYADIFDVTVSVGQNIAPQPGSPTFVTFVAGPVSPVTSTFEVTDGTRVANGISAHIVTVWLKDAYGNPITGDRNSLSGQALPAQVASFTEATPGTYTANITSRTAGTWQVRVSHLDLPNLLDPGSNNRNAIFVAGPPSGLTSTLERTTTNPKLVTTGFHTIRVTVKDADSNIIAYQPLTIRTTPPLALPNGGLVTTDNSGVAELSFTSSTATTYTIYADIPLPTGGNVQPQGSGVVQAQFISGPIDPTNPNTWFIVSQYTDVVADGDPDHFQLVTVSLADASGTPISGLDGTGVLTAGSVTFDPTLGPISTAFTEDPNNPGIYTAKITSIKSGTFTVSVTAQQGNPIPLPLKPGDNNKAIFIPGTAVAASILSAQPLTLPVGQTSTAQVIVVDANNNLVGGQPVKFTTTPPGPINTPNNEAVISSNPLTGISTLPLTTTTAGTYTLHATLEGIGTPPTPIPVTNSGNINITWTPDVANATITLTGSTDQSVPVGGDDSHWAQVEVVDPYGNPVPGVQVDFSNTGVGSWSAPALCTTPQACRVTTDANGKARVEIVSNQTGRAQITAKADGKDVTNGGTTPVELILEFGPGVPVDSASRFQVSTDSRLANGSDAHTITVTLVDAFGNGVPGLASQLSAEPTPSAGVSISSFTPGATAGQYTASITSTVAGVKTITVARGTTAIQARDGLNQALFIPGDPAPGNSFFEVSLTPNVVADGDPAHFQTVTVTLRDAQGNLVSGFANRLQPSAISLVGAVQASVSTFLPTGDGVYTAHVTATKALDYRVTVSLLNGVSQSIGHIDTLAVPQRLCNDIASFVAGSPDTELSRLDVSPGLVEPGGEHWAEVTIVDVRGNPVPGVEVHLWTDAPTGGTPITIANGGIVTTDASGKARVTLTTRKAGTYYVFAVLTDSGNHITNSGIKFVTFIAGPPSEATSSLVVPTEALPTPIVANGVDHHRAEVTVRDADYNPVPGVTAQVTITPPGGGTPQTLTTNLTSSSGVGSVEFASTKAGVHVVTAAVIVSGVPREVATGSPANATFVAGPPAVGGSTITVDKYRAEARPSRDWITVTVTVNDQFGNRITTGGADVEILTTLGTVTNFVDNGDGTYTARLSSSQGGPATVAFRIGSQTSSGPAPLTREVSFIRTPSTPIPRFANATTVVGTADPGNTIRIYHEDVEVCVTLVAADGTFRCEPMVPQQLDGARLVIVATDSYGYKSDPAGVTVRARKPLPPIVDPTNGTEVTGEAEPGTTITVRDDDGRVLCTTTTNPDGSFRCRPLVPRPAHLDPIHVTATDDAENTSDPTTVIVDSQPPEPPEVEPTDGTVIYGTAEPDTDITIKNDKGIVICRTRTNSAGSFACFPAVVPDHGTPLEVTATDAAGNTSRPTIVVVDRDALPKPVIHPTNGSKVNGTGRPGATVVVTFPNGDQATATVDPNANWSVQPPPTYTPRHGDVITAYQEVPFNRDGPKRSDTASVIVDRTPPDAPILKPSDGTTLSGEGEPNTYVTVRDADGNVIGTGKVNPDGRFTVPLNPQAKEGDIVTVTLTDDAGNVSRPSSLRIGLMRIVVDKAQLYVLEEQTARIYNLQPGEKVSATMLPDGLDLGTTIADANGIATFTWSVPTASGMAGHKVEAIGEISGKVTSDPFLTMERNGFSPKVETITPSVTVTAAPTVSVTPGSKDVTGKSGGAHPTTGAEGLIPALGAALGALLSGLVLLVAARRRREDEGSEMAI